MKKSLCFLWRNIFAGIFVLLLFWVSIPSARAPMGNKKFLGGRTIASIQEEDFDKTLYRYQYCYGLQLRGERATQERRRACKAILVRSIEEALQRKPGAYFRHNMVFQCEDTALGPLHWKDTKQEDTTIIALRPNHEEIVIAQAILENLDYVSSASPELEAKAKDICNFYVDCKKAMRLENFSVRKIGSCLAERDEYKRRVILNSVSKLIFRAPSQKGMLVSEVLHGD